MKKQVRKISKAKLVRLASDEKTKRQFALIGAARRGTLSAALTCAGAPEVSCSITN